MTDAIVDALLAARKARRPIDPAPYAIDDLAEAVAIQTRAQEKLGGAIAGWKVSLAPDRSGLCAPMLAPLPDAASQPPIRPGHGVVKVEIELAVKLKRDLPPRPGKPYSRADILEAVDHVFYGVELLEGRFEESRSFNQFVADQMANLTYIIGPKAPADALDRVASMRGVLKRDGKEISDAPCVHPTGDPLAALVACANLPQARLGGFRAGQIVTLGALTGPITVATPGAFEATLTGVGTVNFKLAAA